MERLRIQASGLFFVVAALVGACGDDDPPPPAGPPPCVPGAACEGGQVCEEVEGGAPACFAPLVLSGHVFDVADESPIEGALVVARNVNGAAISPVATTNAAGEYSLRVPGKRLQGGALAAGDVTLRADAAGYLTFPKAPRQAVPIDLTVATGNPPTLMSTLTEIGLIGLPDTDAFGSISGRVLSAHPAGTLVVADGVTGIADTNGDYTVFNVPAGTIAVEGYSPRVNLVPASVELAAGDAETGVDLAVAGDASAVVSGNVQIVNAPGGLTTSVILVVESTFEENTARGEAPPGLRIADVSGDWAIEDVPDGRYLALAAFENDFLVRDPDTSIGGTDLVTVTVEGESVDVGEGFKVTEALEVVGPGVDEPEEVTAPFDLSWEDDSSEDTYDVVVFDALGNLTWETTGVVGPGGNQPVVVAYDGPALEPGMYYQFRATSIKDGVPISQTEDLRGVFFAR